jgi:hypothetical protein
VTTRVRPSACGSSTNENVVFAVPGRVNATKASAASGPSICSIPPATVQKRPTRPSISVRGGASTSETKPIRVRPSMVNARSGSPRIRTSARITRERAKSVQRSARHVSASDASTSVSCVSIASGTGISSAPVISRMPRR